MLLALGVFVWPSIARDVAVAAPGATSAYTPIEPCRLLDTRLGDVDRPAAGDVVDVQVTERCGITDTATAVVVTITAVDASTSGFLLAWAAGEPQPQTSTLNYSAGSTIANTAIVGVGLDGGISILPTKVTDVLIDVTGFFVPAETSRAGRFVPLRPQRLIDTRTAVRPAARTTIRVDAPMIPRDAEAVAITLTSPSSFGSAFVTAFAAGAETPNASLLNIDRWGQTRATSAIVPVSDRGFSVFSDGASHVVVDITGYFTGPSAAESTEGLFVRAEPVRLVDTRASEPGLIGGPQMYARAQREFPVEAVTGGPVAAVAANWTVVRAGGVGWYRADAAGVPVDMTSTMNTSRWRETIASMAITQVSERGLGFYADQNADLIVDVTGWFQGSPIAATEPPPTNNVPPRKVTVISDSAMAGMRWNRALAGMQGFVADHRLESCRRLVARSCNGREGYRPRTAYQEILRLPQAEPRDVLVIGTGYNDWYGGIESHIRLVLDAARSKGYETVVWATLRELVSYTLPRDQSHQRSNYRFMNDIVRSIAASGAYPELVIWDLNHYTAGATSWFYPDGVHETRLGSWGVADWISRHIAAMDGKRCVVAWSVGGERELPCPNPDLVVRQRGLPNIPALYGV
jgi:hypothetical protein